MDSLRLILLTIGIIIIVAIYSYEKYRRQRNDKRYSKFGGTMEDDFVPRQPQSQPKPASEVDFGDVPDDLEEDYDAYEDEVTTEEAIRNITEELQQLEGMIAERDRSVDQLELDDLVTENKAEAAGTDNQPGEIIVVNVFARDDRVMSGPDILEVTLQQDLQFGDMSFFHRMNKQGQVVFSMANALQPGSFDIASMESLSTRGLVLFMTIPGPGDPLENFDAMLSTARELASALHGQLHDETRSVLTRQGIDAIRTRISEYKLKTSSSDTKTA